MATWTVAVIGGAIHQAKDAADALAIMARVEHETGRGNITQLRADGQSLSPLNAAAFAEYQAACKAVAA